MTKYIIGRLLQGLVTVWAMSVIIFVLARLAGSPVDLMLPEFGTAQEKAELTARLGLDKPLVMQYGIFLGNLVQGDLGRSVFTNEPVHKLMVERAPNTLLLGGVAAMIAIIIAVPIGVFSALRANTWVDTFAKSFAILGLSLPAFWLGIVFIYIFAVRLTWFPPGGTGGVSHIILPAFAIGWHVCAGIMRLVRSSMLNVLSSDYIRTARSKGLASWPVLWRHALRNALIAPITFFAVLMVALLTGSIVVETVFAWPGLGQLSYQAMLRRDFPVMQGVVLVFTSIFVLVNLAVDVLYVYVDPRIRIG